MKRVFAGALTGLLLVVAAASYSFAQMPGCGGCPGSGIPGKGMPGMHDGSGMMGRGHHAWRLLKSLGLDEKQMTAVKDIRTRVAKDTVRKRADLQIVRIDLRNILAKDQVDMSAAEASLKKIAALQTDIRLSHIKAMQEVKALLTPEQRKKLDDLREMGPFAGTMNSGTEPAPPAEEEQG